MSAIGIGPQAREQLERILESPGFLRNERQSRFLRFVVERHIEGRDRELKESLIGIEVFGRRPDYNPKSDAIVRTEAGRLRTRLAEYYANGGNRDAVIIELPKGGYVPVVRIVEGRPASAASRAKRRPRPFWAVAGAAGVVTALSVAGWARLGRPESGPNPQVRDLYVRARAVEMGPGVKNAGGIIELFRKVSAIDPSFAPAYAGIAVAYAERSAFDRFTLDQRAEMIAEGWAAAEKAIHLNPRLADSYDALGMMQARQAQWQEAERSFRRAIELAPRDPLWRNHFGGFFLLPLGRVEEALRELRRAEEIDQRSLGTQLWLGIALYAAGRFDESDRHFNRAAENDRGRSQWWAPLLLRQGKADQAIQILEPIWRDHLLDVGAEVLGVAYARVGRRGDAERVAAIVPRPSSKVAIFAALRDKDRTFEMLDQMIPMGPARIGYILINPDYAFLRGDPRLKELRKRVGLPE